MFLFQINPQHTAPAIVDNGFALSESRAIIKYLVAKYGGNKYYPQDIETRALVDQRLDFDIGTVYPKLIDVYVSMKLTSAKVVVVAYFMFGIYSRSSKKVANIK